MKHLATAGLFVAAVLGALILGEVGARLFVNPGDFLLAARRPDPILDYRVEPGAGGHDAWGFRNAEVPEAVARRRRDVLLGSVERARAAGRPPRG